MPGPSATWRLWALSHRVQEGGVQERRPLWDIGAAQCPRPLRAAQGALRTAAHVSHASRAAPRVPTGVALWPACLRSSCVDAAALAGRVPCCPRAPRTFCLAPFLLMLRGPKRPGPFPLCHQALPWEPSRVQGWATATPRECSQHPGLATHQPGDRSWEEPGVRL